MGFESYTVVLTPRQIALPGTDRSMDTVPQMVGDLRQRWSVIRLDEKEVELRSLNFPLAEGEVCLVYETAQGLFQLLLTPYRKQVSISLRFAYCNPRTVYQPFIRVTTWMMERYQRCASVMASDDVPEVNNPQEVESVFIPSMDYNRRLWQADARTSEEAILRPGDAIVRFISPHYLGAALV